MIILSVIFMPGGIYGFIRIAIENAARKRATKACGCKERGINDGSSFAASHVTMQFGGLKAVNDVDMEIKKGEVHALIGPNGAGKTTFFNIVSGIYTPTSGTVTFDGKTSPN